VARKKDQPSAKAGKSKPVLRVIGGEPGKSSAEDKRYFAELHRLIDSIFQRATDQFDWSWSQLATNANLTYVTVHRLGERITMYPRFRTVYCLAKAVGWSLVTKEEIKKQAGTPKLKVAMG
jgi:ribosome-binding protein aMBF1 (putative translation factor)